MAVSSEEIKNIQNNAKISEIVGTYINLEKKGKNYFGVCPFHDDHNPSMSVNDEKGLFTCFVCHKTGTVFTFVQDYLNVSFLEAVKIVADKVGIEISTGYKITSKYDKYYEANELAIKFYQNNLKSVSGKKAREYLKNRGITDEIIDEFNIGYAPKEYNTLVKLLTGKNFDEEMLIDVGLANRGNTLYDLFRDRIIFPIHDSRGHPVAFSGRLYEDKAEAKYINTKETKIFTKGDILFNYHRAINEARKMKYLILVEGYMDAIRLYVNGIKNVVATMGTALTASHTSLLKKANVKIILCMDNDSAGEIATLKNGEILSSSGCELRILRLTEAKDPDEYILKHSRDEFIDAVNHAVTFFDFKMNYLKNDKNLDKIDDVSKYINQVIAELNKTQDEVLIDLTVNKLVEDFKVDKNVILNQIIKIEPKPNELVKIEKINKRKLSKNQKLASLLIYYMMNDVKYIKLYEQELSYIPDKKYMDIANDLLAFYLKYNYINIADFITNEIESEYYDEILNIIDEFINNELIDNEFVGIITKIKDWIIDEQIQKLKKKLQSISDINEKLKITNEIAKLKKRDVE